MGIGRTAKGTSATKASGADETLAAVASVEGRALTAIVAYDNSQGNPTVKWGNHDFKLVPNSRQANPGTGMTIEIWRKLVRKTGTRDVVVTWPAAIAARVLIVTEWQEVSRKDVGQSNAQDGTGSPATGAAVTTTVAATGHVAGFASKGPSGDTPGSAGVGHTLGQRAGTTGGAAASNITVQETFEILAVTGNTRATLSGATSRDWASTIVALRAADVFECTRAFIAGRVQDRDGDRVVLVFKDGAGNEVFEHRIPVDVFDDDLTADADVLTDAARSAVRYQEMVVDGDPVETGGDAARDTRIAGLVGETVTV